MSDKPRSYPALESPMLAPNKCLGLDIPFSSISWPKLCSTKYNGVRALTMDGTWRSRNMKPSTPMSQEVAYVFKEILDYAYDNSLVLDGEFHSNTYNTVGETRSIMAGTIPLPDDFMFKCFYAMPYSVWNGTVDLPMSQNLPETMPSMARFKAITHTLLHSKGEFLSKIEQAKNLNIEGFMLLDPHGYYKHGRGTVRQQLLYKYKFYADKEDAKVVGLIPRRARKPGVQSEEHPTGLAKAVYTQDSFIPTDIAGTMMCLLNGQAKQVIHVPFPIGWDMAMRKRAFVHFGTGSEYDIEHEWVSFQRLAVEDRDKPISIKGVEFRDSKD